MAVRRWYWMIAVAGLVAGCNSHECKEMGCIAGVEVRIANQFPVAMLPVEVTTCAESQCRTETYLAGSVQGQSTFIVSGTVILDETHERDVAVTVEVTSTGGGAVLLQASGTAHLRRSQPNGAGCAPVCYSAVLTYPGSGASLVQP
jgi:hypothetical protein